MSNDIQQSTMCLCFISPFHRFKRCVHSFLGWSRVVILALLIFLLWRGKDTCRQMLDFPWNPSGTNWRKILIASFIFLPLCLHLLSVIRAFDPLLIEVFLQQRWIGAARLFLRGPFQSVKNAFYSFNFFCLTFIHVLTPRLMLNYVASEYIYF